MAVKKTDTVKKLSHAIVYDSESLAEIDVNKIRNNPLQPRLHVDDKSLDELAKSIQRQGLIQPISVIKKDDQYILQAGQRRWLAHKKMGLKKIKAIISKESTLTKNEDEKSLFEIAISENLQREDLDPLELAISLQNVLDKKLYKNREMLSKVIGKSASYVGKVLKILALDSEIIEDLKMNKSVNDIESLYEIQKISDKKEQKRVYDDFVTKKIDREGLRELNRSKKDTKEKKVPYAFENRAKNVKFQYDTSTLTDEEIRNINKELVEVLDKYFPDLYS